MGDKLPENLAAFLPVQSDSFQFSDYHELLSKPVDESKLEEYFSEVQRLLEHTGNQDKIDRVVKHEKWGKVEMARQLYNEQRGIDIGIYTHTHTHKHTHTHTHTHTHNTYAYTHTNTHTHTHMRIGDGAPALQPAPWHGHRHIYAYTHTSLLASSHVNRQSVC
jgi:YesN/AraC family two-component response regulator